MMVDIVDDEEVFQSIMNSGRKIESLVITSENQNQTLNQQRLREVIENIGENIKELQIRWRSLDIDGVDLLNLMPNLQKLELCYNSCEKLKVPESFQLRLNNLKELNVQEMSEKIFEALYRLPDNVLDRLALGCIPITVSRSNLFGNQRNLKNIVTSLGVNVEFFDMHQLKLKSLTVLVHSNLCEVLRGQDELTSLHLYLCPFSQEILDFICNEMKSLEILYLIGHRSDKLVDLSKIQLLKNLKKLSLGGFPVKNLEILRSNSLQALEVFKLPKEAEFPINCPNLREFSVDELPEIFRVDKFLRHFPRLEKFSYTSGTLRRAKGWENHSLKHILTQIIYRANNLNKLTEIFKGLKSFSLTKKLPYDEMKHLLTEVPNLKKLCSGDVSKEVVELIKEYGGNIESIHFHWNRFIKEVEVEEVKEIFKDQLPLCKIKRECNKVHLFMKRFGVMEECCEIHPASYTWSLD